VFVSTALKTVSSACRSRMNIDFSFDFHIRKNCKNRAQPAWILDFGNQLHRFLVGRLWMHPNSLILHGLFIRKTV